MASLLDMEEVFANVEAHKARAQQTAAGDKLENMLSRMQIEVGGPLSIWRAKESNSNTNPNFVLHGLNTLFAGTMVAELKENMAGATLAELTETAGRALHQLADSVAELLNMPEEAWESLACRIEPTEGGRA